MVSRLCMTTPDAVIINYWLRMLIILIGKEITNFTFTTLLKKTLMVWSEFYICPFFFSLFFVIVSFLKHFSIYVTHATAKKYLNVFLSFKLLIILFFNSKKKYLIIKLNAEIIDVILGSAWVAIYLWCSQMISWHNLLIIKYRGVCDF